MMISHLSETDQPTTAVLSRTLAQTRPCPQCVAVDPHTRHAHFLQLAIAQDREAVEKHLVAQYIRRRKAEHLPPHTAAVPAILSWLDTLTDTYRGLCDEAGAPCRGGKLGAKRTHAPRSARGGPRGRRSAYDAAAESRRTPALFRAALS